MMKSKHVILFAALFILAGVTGAFALEISGTPPQFSGSGADTFNGYVNTAWDEVKNQINAEIGKIDTKPEKLIKGFADASVFASQGATQRGYGEPKYFTFTVGSMVGVKVGSSIGGVADYFKDIQDTIKKDGDLAVGLNAQAISGQFNLNTSRFLLDGLDLGLRFGIFKLTNGDFEDLIGGSSFGSFGFDTLSFGVVGNYQLIKAKTLVPILVKWRGLSLGTGFIYQNTKLRYEMPIDGDFESDITTGASLRVDDLKVYFDMTTTTFTIPLEASTAIQLFSFLNITLGVGVDFAFGSNDMTIGADGTINAVGSGLATYNQTKPGNLELTAGGNVSPSFFNPKLMTGVGFKIGPIIIDVPVTLYFGDGTGANVGLTLGVSI